MKKLLLSILLLGGLSASAQSDSLFKTVSNKDITLANVIASSNFKSRIIEAPKPSLFDVTEELVLVSREYLVDKTKLKSEQVKRASIKKEYESNGFAFKEVKVIDAKCYLVFVK